MTTTLTDAVPVDYRPDGRTKLARQLARYDALHAARDAAKRVFEDAQADLDSLGAAIKAEVAGRNLGIKVDLDTPELAYKLRYGVGDVTRMTKEDGIRLRHDHPEIWADYTTTTSVSTLRRLTGRAHLKPGV